MQQTGSSLSKLGLRDRIVAGGCYTREENLRIYEKWFRHGPRYLFRAVDRKYRLSQMILCDIGCSFGTNLFFCRPQSYGIEINERAARFANSVGLTVYRRDVLRDDLCDLPRAEAVWCSAVLEHVDSPHILLRKIHLLLVSDGVLALYCPTLPLIPWLRRLPLVGRYARGYRASDHINAFTPATLRFFCERAGFRTEEVSPFFPGPLRLFNHMPFFSRLVGHSVYIGRKVEGWDYPMKATRRQASNERGFVSRAGESERVEGCGTAACPPGGPVRTD